MTRISYSHDGSHPTYGATYRMWFRLPVPNPNLNPNLNPNPKTDPNPNSNNNLYSAKRHPNKVQDSVINTSYFVGQEVGAYKVYNREASTTDDLSGTRVQNRGLGGVIK